MRPFIRAEACGTRNFLPFFTPEESHRSSNELVLEAKTSTSLLTYAKPKMATKRINFAVLEAFPLKGPRPDYAEVNIF